MNIHCSPVIQWCAPRPISDGRLPIPNRNPGTCPTPGTGWLLVLQRVWFVLVSEGAVASKRWRTRYERWSLRLHVVHAPPCTKLYAVFIHLAWNVDIIAILSIKHGYKLDSTIKGRRLNTYQNLTPYEPSRKQLLHNLGEFRPRKTVGRFLGVDSGAGRCKTFTGDHGSFCGSMDWYGSSDVKTLLLTLILLILRIKHPTAASIRDI